MRVKKRRVLAFLFALLLALPLAVTFAEEKIELTIGVIKGSGVAMRSDASTGGKLITRLDEGEVVSIRSGLVNSEWYKVTSGKRTGYVNRVYINIEQSLDEYNLSYTGTVSNVRKDVNVRAEPKSGSKVLGKAKLGEALPVTKAYVSAKFHEVTFEGKKGYISVDYLTLGAKVSDKQLSSLTVEGGTLYPSFSPNVYGYTLVADRDSVTVKTAANKGVKIDVGGTGSAEAKYTINSGNSKTIRIALDGTKKYSIYLVRDVLTVGTWNIKRGNDHMIEQGWLIDAEKPDLLGVQEVYVKTKERTNNLLSIRTREMQEWTFSKTISYQSGGEYGIGQISRWKPEKVETFELDTGSAKEPRILQKVVYDIDGKKVSFYNTHFSYESASIRRKQFDKVYKTMQADTNKYKILTGDFNAKEDEFYEFKKGSYKVVNTSSTKFYDYSHKRIGVNQIDNIIVSDSITVLNARAIPNSYSDHYPLFAFLKLK